MMLGNVLLTHTREVVILMLVGTICLSVLMVVGLAFYQAIRKTKGKPLTLPPPKATADDVRSYPQKDDDVGD